MMVGRVLSFWDLVPFEGRAVKLQLRTVGVSLVESKPLLLLTLQEINISHLGKRKIIFKYAIFGGYVSSLEGKYSKLVSMKFFGASWGYQHPIFRGQLVYLHP